MKLIAEDIAIEFSPEGGEAAIAIAILEVIREPNGNGTMQSDVVLVDKTITDVLAELIADGHLTVTHGNGDTAAIEEDISVPLAPKQQATLNWLIKNDKPEGLSVPEAVRAFKVDYNTARARLTTLIGLGLAKRVHRGYYRAVTLDG